MNNQNFLNIKVKAFSIIEASISLVVTAIILGIIFAVFTILSQGLIQFKNENLKATEVNRLTYAINKDIFDNKTITLLGNQFVFSNNKDTVFYTMIDSKLVRKKNTFIDTFFIKINTCKEDTLVLENGKQYFQRINIEMFEYNSTDTLRFYKKIESNDLLLKQFDNEY